MSPPRHGLATTGSFHAGSQVAALCGRQLRRTLRAPGKFVGIAMNPVVMIVALGFVFERAIVLPGDADYRSYIVAGVAVQVGLSCIGPTGISVTVDQKSGMVSRMRTMPARSWSVLIAQMFADLAAAVVALGLVSVIGLVIGWRPAGSITDLGLSYLLLLSFYAAMIWLGILLGLFIKNPETIEPIGALLLVVFSFVSSAFLPPEYMPPGIATFAEWNPVSAVAASCRELWGLPAGSTSSSFAALHPQLIAWGSIVLILAVCVTASIRLLGRATR